MDLTLLCIGDVVGNPGRQVLRDGLQCYAENGKVHCVIANAENTAGGSGLTTALYEKILQYGVDAVTFGDHIYRRRDIIGCLERSEKMVRPANLPMGAPGRQLAIVETNSGHQVAVISLLGRLFMKTMADCPFAAVDRVLATVPKDVNVVVVDMHAEATSEKIALGWHLDGRVSLVFGTHTHVPTADECILPQGTAYITDLGMTGPYDSILGREKALVLSSMISAVPNRFDVASGDLRMCGVLVTVDSSTGKAKSIERVCHRMTENTSGHERTEG